MKKTLFFSAALVLLAASTAFGLAINLDPPSLHLSIAAGKSQSGTIKLTNNGDTPIQIKAYVEDWLFAKDGSKNFKPAGSTPRSCAYFINLYPSSFELKPGEGKLVSYAITMPTDASGGYHAVIFFESQPAGAEELAGKGRQAQVLIAGRIGTIVYLDTEGKTKKTGSITDVVIGRADENKPLDIEISFKNDADTHLLAEGTVIITDKDGKVAGRMKTNRLGTLVGESVKGKVSWMGKIEEGDYTALVTLDYGGDEPAIFEKRFSVQRTAEIFKITAAQNQKTIKVLLRNSGNFSLTASGDVEIRTADGKMIEKLSLAQVKLLPGSDKYLTAKWRKDLPAGKYKALASLIFDGQTITKEADFTIK